MWREPCSGNSLNARQLLKGPMVRNKHLWWAHLVPKDRSACSVLATWTRCYHILQHGGGPAKNPDASTPKRRV